MIARAYPPGAVAAEAVITIPNETPRVFSCSSTTNGSSTLTTTTGAFTQELVGLAVTGIGIPAGTTVSSVQSPTSLTLSGSASDSTTNVRYFGGTSINCTKAGTATITSAALFGNVFTGMYVTGQGIPANTRVVTVTSQSSIVLNNAATDSLTGTLTFHYPRCSWKLKSLKMRFATDANAANRVCRFSIDDGANTVYALANDIAQIANITCDWNAAPGGSMEAAPATNATARMYSMPEIMLGPGWRIQTSATNKQVGDQWSQIVLGIEEVVTRPE